MLAAQPRELALYALVIVITFVYLARAGYTYSLNFERGGAWSGRAPGLRPGWLWGRSVDLSDIQWREFRSSLPALSAAFALFVAASHLHRALLCRTGRVRSSPSKCNGGAAQHNSGSPGGSSEVSVAGGVLGGCAADAACGSRPVLYLALALPFLGYLHGAAAAFPLGLAVASFWVSRLAAGRQHGAAMIWSFNIAALLAARIYDGFRFGSISPALAALDSHRGAVRWEICFNLSLLRMLSFGLDLHWRAQRAQQAQQQAQQAQQQQQQQRSAAAVCQAGVEAQQQEEQLRRQGKGGQQGDGEQRGLIPPQQEVPQQQGSRPDNVHSPSAKPNAGTAVRQRSQQLLLSQQEAAARLRQRTPLPEPADYGLLTYLAYVTYPPLYLAGPIVTYQDFAWQLRRPVRLSGPEVLRCAVRFAADLACLELLTHTLYFNSLAKHRVGARLAERGLQFGPTEIVLAGFWVLCFMWLKFAAIWRFFRLAALADGIFPPENMRRCFANNYDVEGFWKGWHSSYNAWLVRYMYVPLGGTRWRLLNIWPIFLFVAVWHDLEWRLLAWAWLVCLAFMPELLVKRAAASPRLAAFRSTTAYRHAAAALASLNIFALMAANLAGFVVGADGLAALAQVLLAQPRLLAASAAVFFSAVQLMFWVRAREAAAAAAEAGAGAGAGAGREN